jgi:hypothetical protein
LTLADCSRKKCVDTVNTVYQYVARSMVDLPKPCQAHATPDLRHTKFQPQSLTASFFVASMHMPSGKS